MTRKVGIAADDKEAFFRKLVIVNQDRSVDRYGFHILRNATVLIDPYLNHSSMMQPSVKMPGFDLVPLSSIQRRVGSGEGFGQYRSAA